MEQNKRYRIWMTAFAVFLVFMWLCTIISKSVYVSGLPGVQTQQIDKKYIEHVVEAEGIIVEGGEQAVNTLAGLRVQRIFANKGDRVEVGDVLFEIDVEDLCSQIQKQETEIARLNYQIADLEFNQVLSSQKREINALWAQEDYDAADYDTAVAVERAEAARQEAQKALSEHLQEGVSVTGEEDRQKAQEDYDAWVRRLEELQEAAAQQEKVVSELENQLEQALSEREAQQAEKLNAEYEENTDGIRIEDVQTEEITADKNKTEELSDKLEEAKQELARCEATIEAHQNNAVEQPDYSIEDLEYKNWQEETESLKKALQSAEYAKEDAETNRNQTLKQEARAVAGSLVPDSLDSSAEQCRLQLAELQNTLSQYQAILSQNGKVTSVSGGMVTEILITTGGRTTDTAAILLTEDEIPCRFKLTITKEQKKYINIGDEVEVTLANDGTELLLTADYMTESTSGMGYYDIYMELPQGVGQPGMIGSVEQSVQGELRGCCLPIEALYSEDNRYYVYIVKEKDGILGTELYVERMDVNVLDKNDRYVAIEEGVLSKEDAVIIYSTEEVSRGDSVKYMD